MSTGRAFGPCDVCGRINWVHNTQFYATESGTDFASTKVRVHAAFALEIAFAPLAQLAEQVTLNHWVAGSIPARCTILSNRYTFARWAFGGPCQMRGSSLLVRVRPALVYIRLDRHAAAPSAPSSRQIRV
jgi:hypothetical protein